MKKFSIIIPTYNHCNDLLKPCIESIIKYTDLSLNNIEVIIVANGCTDNTIEYLSTLNNDIFKVIEIKEKLGYTKSTNIGIKYAEGEYIVLLNNDLKLLPQEKNEWLNRLYQPFIEDKKIGITGICFSYISEPSPFDKFLIFFCVMIPKRIINEIGLLDESYNPGGGEDADYCFRCIVAGYKIKNVTTFIKYEPEGNLNVNDYPLYHKAEGTMHDPEHKQAWQEILTSHIEQLRKKIRNEYMPTYLKNKILDSKDVTVEISTRNRYYTTLPLCLMAIANQTVKPKKILLFDDGEQKDLREISYYKNIFSVLDYNGIEWNVIFGERKGQVLNHQKAIELTETKLIWRLDDDNIPEPNVLEKLLATINEDEKIGAVASLVLHPNSIQDFKGKTDYCVNKISELSDGINAQWGIYNENEKIKNAEHLYSTFLYKKEAGKHGYCKQLSSVGHREETIFTYEMKRNGWTLLIRTDAITWHFRETTGGIRDFSESNNWNNDEKIFKQKMIEWGKDWEISKLIILDNGLGDHYAFKHLMNDLINKYSKIVMAVCYPEVFSEYKDVVKLISIADAINLYGNIEEYNIYRWMEINNWNKSMVEAYKKMYNI